MLYHTAPYRNVSYFCFHLFFSDPAGLNTEDEESKEDESDEEIDDEDETENNDMDSNATEERYWIPTSSNRTWHSNVLQRLACSTPVTPF